MIFLKRAVHGDVLLDENYLQCMCYLFKLMVDVTGIDTGVYEI